MLMELGFHNSDMLHHILKTDSQRREASAIMCSVIILDRQWSAMTGLPANFPNAAFSLTPIFIVSHLVLLFATSLETSMKYTELIR
jgi:hypothetical protein